MTPIPQIDIKDYDYFLSEERIAKYPLSQRDQCKLLCYKKGETEDSTFGFLPQLLPPSSFLVRNNTRVIKARLHFFRSTGASIEIFCLEPVSPSLYEENLTATGACSWACLIGNARRWKETTLSTTVHLKDGTTTELRAQRSPLYSDRVDFSWDNHNISFGVLLEALGELPIPPYLKRKTSETDLLDYQTVYAHKLGSVAAPTAGLHFTEDSLKNLLTKGHSISDITLHVGAGTFLPVKTELVNDHIMHKEFCTVSTTTVEALLKAQGKPIIPIGTTSVRTLESLFWLASQMVNPTQVKENSDKLPHIDQWIPYTSFYTDLSREEALHTILSYLQKEKMEELNFTTSLIIIPGYRYRMIDGLITNFHQPQSTLLLLIAALIGQDWRKVYTYALENEYRFLSYGDACLLLP